MPYTVIICLLFVCLFVRWCLCLRSCRSWCFAVVALLFLQELRRYSLKLGYDTVPKFLAYYERGLPSKLENQDESTSLCSVLCSEVGDLNQVIEVWRHGNGVRAMAASRQSARQAQEWRSAISEIATLAVSFNCTVFRPTKFSNWQ